MNIPAAEDAKPNRWFSLGHRRSFRGAPGFALRLWAFGIACLVIYAAVFAVITPWALAALFLGGMFSLVFLYFGPSPNGDRRLYLVIDIAFATLSIAMLVYVYFNLTRLLNRVPILDELQTLDFVLGGLILFLTLEATRRTAGLGMLLIVFIFIAYNLLGHHLGGTLYHGYVDVSHFIEIAIFTTDGVFGLPVRVAATYAFLFVLFGTLLSVSGGSEFFFQLAASLSGRTSGGPAKVAVVSSAIYGMMSGSPTSDVMTTGSITIPMMKRIGYQAGLAGGIEVAASTGGSLLPPVMGSAAFIMAEYTGIAYKDIAVAALLPALLYYVGVFVQVHLRSKRLGLGTLPEDAIPRILPTLLTGGQFIIPLGVITVALLLGYTPTMVAVFGGLAVFAVAAIRPQTRIGLNRLFDALATTSIRMIPVTGACAAAGLVIAGISMTGLTGKFAHVIESVAGTSVFATLLIAAGVSIILGMGMPTPSAYILAAVMLAPHIVALKVPLLSTHLFLLYFAVLSALTPPIAVAAYAASSIAEANPFSIAFSAVKLVFVAFVVPFAFVYNEALLFEGGAFEIIVTIVRCGAAAVLMCVAVEGFAGAALNMPHRLLTSVCSVLLFVPHLKANLAAIALVVAAFALREFRARLSRQSS